MKYTFTVVLHRILRHSLRHCGEAKSHQTHDLHKPQTMHKTRPNHELNLGVEGQEG